ncbi:MAG: hypothetical protein ACI9KE_004894 [Polyangiales bacterium]|jgi:hypothetical protein
MFREQQRRCPQCRAGMRKEPIPSGEVVDVCECGVFADYFDGEPRELAKLFDLPAPINADKGEEHLRTCAGCGEIMELLRYERGPLLHRCHGCASVFMTPKMLKALRHYEGEFEAIEAPTLLGRVARWFESL